MNKKQKAIKAFFGEAPDVMLDMINSCREGNIATICLCLTDAEGYTWGHISIELIRGYNHQDIEQAVFENSSIIAVIGNAAAIAYKSYLKYGKDLNKHLDDIYRESAKESVVVNYKYAAENGLVDVFYRQYGIALTKKIIETVLAVEFYDLNETSLLEYADNTIKQIVHKYMMLDSKENLDNFFLKEVERLNADEKHRKILMQHFNMKTPYAYLAIETATSEANK